MSTAAYRATHREEQAAYDRAHREERAVYNRDWDAAHREKRAAYHATHRATHREEIAAYDRAYSATHRDEKRAYHLNHVHGITQDEWDGLFAYQDGVCVGCDNAPATCVDHDHETGAIRGLLCHPCNLADALGTA